jgi:hypothetical protein
MGLLEPIKEPHAQHRAICVPCWYHVCHVGAMWEPDGAMWEANGTIWELHGSQYWSGVSCMGATCAIWEPGGAGWEVYTTM